MRVGIFGGTFDPPHTGHLIVAQDAASALGLDRVLFVPAAQPPHKQNVAISPAPLRLRMLELAVGRDSRFAIDRLELERQGASYTVDTLRQLRSGAPETEWTLIIGADQYREFGTWREPAAILELARLAVVSRHGHAGEDEAGPAVAAGAATDPNSGDGSVARLAVTRIDISSTMIRQRVAQGLPIRYLVPEAVERFILEQRLYSRNGAVGTGYHPGHADI